MPNAWGYEALLDLGGCDRSVTMDPVALDAWVSDLVAAIGMQAHGRAQIVHFGEGDLAGWTVLQLITTSNITAHFNDVDGSAYINVHSCRPYTLSTVMDQITRVLKPATIHARFLSRQAGRGARELAHEARVREVAPV